MENKIEILFHDVKIEMDVIADEEMMDEIHDAIHEEMWEGYKEGTVEMFMEVNEISQDVNVKWKIIDYREIAEKLYKALETQLQNPDVKGYPEEAYLAIVQYEQMINMK